MESTWDCYYGITKKLSLLAGQWPYQSKNERLLKISIITTSLLVVNIPQVRASVKFTPVTSVTLIPHSTMDNESCDLCGTQSIDQSLFSYYYHYFIYHVSIFSWSQKPLLQIGRAHCSTLFPLINCIEHGEEIQ